MSLDNIQLPPSVIQVLFKNFLVGLDTDESKPNQDNNNKLSFLGDNTQNILILVNNPEFLYLSDPQMSFLTGILAACKLTIADVSILNLNKSLATNYTTINNQLDPRITLMFGVSPSMIGLPFEIPIFQVQNFTGRTYLVAPAFDELENNKILKRQLWENLKQILKLD